MNSPSVRRAHHMPFGAEARQDGTTRFRVWAPAAESVALWLEAEGRALPMTRDAAGWAELVTRDAPTGTRYRFRIDGDLLVPDPASRFQPSDVHGPSEVVDPLAHGWTDAGWGGVAAERLVFKAQWNDDVHHALHVLVTGERVGYYADYDPPIAHLGRCLTQGFSYQGDLSPHRGRPRGEPSASLPPTAFVGFLQNHGRRIYGLGLTSTTWDSLPSWSVGWYLDERAP